MAAALPSMSTGTLLGSATPSAPTNPTTATLTGSGSSGSSSTGLLSSVNTSLDPSSATGGTVNFLSPSTSALASPVTANSGDSNNQPSNFLSTPAAPVAGAPATPQSLLPTDYTPTSFGSPQPTTTPPASTYGAQYTGAATGPTDWNVTPNQTVSGQYAQLMQKGNPAIQAVEQATLRGYAAHGGANDLMASTAAATQGSQLALQIAASDAATYAAAGQFNATAANNFNSQINQVIANSILSSQNFSQGMAMLNGQTNQQIQLLSAQVNVSAATAAINLNSFAAQTQISQNATLQQMQAQYGYNVGEMTAQAGIASQQALQQFGFSMQLNYLGQLSNLQANLMNEIGQIQSNPNITQTQAQGAVSDSINQFNTFMAQLNAYYGSMMPSASKGGTTSTGTTTTATPSSATAGASSSVASAASSTYNTPAYNYTYIDAANWPSPSVNTRPGLISSNTSVSNRTTLAGNVSQR